MTNGQGAESEHGHEHGQEHEQDHDHPHEHAAPEPMSAESSEKPHVVWSSAPQSYPESAAHSEPDSGGSEGSPHHE
jgi:hypothetical protein